MRCRFVEVLGSPVFVREWGEATAPAVLYWDGIGGCGLHANELAPVLRDRFGLRVISLDPPGHGRSGAVPLASYRPSLLADLAARVLEQLDGAHVGFAGFSWGARIACSFGARFPERVLGLVLIEGGYLEWRDLPGVDPGASFEACIAEAEVGSDGASFPSWEAYVASEREVLRRWTPAVEDAHRAMMREENGDFVPIVGSDIEGAVRYWGFQEPVTETYPHLAASNVPVLLLAAPPDTGERAVVSATLERLGAALPNATVREVCGGHDLVSDAGPEVAEIAGAWLAALPTA